MSREQQKHSAPLSRSRQTVTIMTCVFSSIVVHYKRIKRGIRGEEGTHKVLWKTIFHVWSAMQEGQEVRVAQGRVQTMIYYVTLRHCVLWLSRWSHLIVGWFFVHFLFPRKTWEILRAGWHERYSEPPYDTTFLEGVYASKRSKRQGKRVQRPWAKHLKQT